MIKLLRNLFLPSASFLIIAGLAWAEWGKLSECKKAANEFHKNSTILVFKDAGDRLRHDRPHPVYQYELNGEVMEFPTHSRIDLPADGRVRMGIDPFPSHASPRSQIPERLLAVPINGPDTVETIYKGLLGHDMAEDYKKVAFVSVAAFVAGIAGFFLQRIIFRDVRKTFVGKSTRRRSKK